MTRSGMLCEYGGTLVEELSVDLRAGNEWMLSQASYRPTHITLDRVMERAARVSREVSARRDEVYLETHRWGSRLAVVSNTTWSARINAPGAVNGAPEQSY